MKFKSNIEAQAKVVVGDLASANATRFPNALSVTSIVPSAVQHNESLYIGLMAEGLSVGNTWASGVYGAGYTNAAGSGRGTGVTGEGHVGTATDTGIAVGVRGYATDIHTGNYNIGLYGDAENGDSGLTYGGNVSLFLANGNIVTSASAAKAWYLGGNLIFNGQGSVKTISATNGAKFDFGGTSSQFVKGDGSLDSNVYALDSTVVHLTGSETISGAKAFTGTISSTISSSTDAIFVDNTGGRGIRINNNSTGFGLIINNGVSSTAIPFALQKGGSTVLSANDAGEITANKFIKLYGTAAQILAADGSVITAGSGITISGGTISSSVTGYVPYTGATSNVDLGSYSIMANSFIKAGGNSTQYLKADGSVSTAMNSRIEVNFIATSGQTTFITPYEVGQVDVYYNGSKLYPNEFTAVNGTDIILATGATLNAQISIVKYVSSLSTTAIRNETTFTTTAGQTTFAVNYSPGQVDVFYNGSKLNISEFTATNGTSVVLGFACAAGESVVIDSYVNQISGASGTVNYVSKFTGAASLGNSQIFDNGTYVGINNINPTEVLDVTGAINVSSAIRSSGEIMIRRSGNELRLGSGVGADYSVFYAGGSERMRITSGGNVGIGTGANVNSRLHVDGQDIYLTGATDNRIRFSNYGFTGNSMGAAIGYVYGVANTQEQGNLAFYTNPNFNSTGSLSERMRIFSSGNVFIGSSPVDTGAKLNVNGAVYASGTLSLGDGTVSNFNAINIGSGVYTNTAAISIGASNPTGGVVSPIITFTAPNASYSYAVRGGMYYNGSNLQMEFRTTSDYRVKEDLIEDFNAIDLLDKIKIYDHKWIGASGRSYSVIAHELQNVIPYLVSGQKDAILEDGSMDLQSVDYSKLVPILIKGIQELKAEIEILKNK